MWVDSRENLGRLAGGSLMRESSTGMVGWIPEPRGLGPVGGGAGRWPEGSEPNWGSCELRAVSGYLGTTIPQYGLNYTRWCPMPRMKALHLSRHQPPGSNIPPPPQALKRPS